MIILNFFKIQFRLSITFASKMKPHKIKLIADATKISNIHSDALNTFRDQQKFKVMPFKKKKTRVV